MPSGGWLAKRSKFSSTAAKEVANTVPDGVATKCQGCGQILFTKDFEKNLKVCPHCGMHHKVTAKERIEYTADEGSFEECFTGLRSADPLQFPEYAQKLKKAVDSTGSHDSLEIGTATIGQIPVILGSANFYFIAGSMGSVFGEKIARAVEEAVELKRPVVLFTATGGGARMQEGLLSLMQMAKTTMAVTKLAAAGLPFIVVMTDPTMAGVLASYASLGDITLAEPGAMIGFAGARVTAQALVQKPPPNYQTAEWQLGRGQIDMIVQRRDIPVTIASLLAQLGFPPIPPKNVDEDAESTVFEASEVSVGN